VTTTPFFIAWAMQRQKNHSFFLTLAASHQLVIIL